MTLKKYPEMFTHALWNNLRGKERVRMISGEILFLHPFMANSCDLLRGTGCQNIKNEHTSALGLWNRTTRTRQSSYPKMSIQLLLSFENGRFYDLPGEMAAFYLEGDGSVQGGSTKWTK